MQLGKTCHQAALEAVMAPQNLGSVLKAPHVIKWKIELFFFNV